MGSNLRIMDDAFEYLLPTEAKKKKGQFFTPRHVVEMCVRIMTAMTSDSYSHGRSGPEYYLPNHTAVEADLLAVLTVPLRKLGHFSCSAFYPAATHLYNDEGRPFLRCVDIVDYPIIPSDQPFARIPSEFADAYSTIRHLKAGDIVISKVGSPCFASLLSEDMENAAMTRTVLGMSHINIEIVDPHYLIAFLRSRYGFDQLMRERELTIQYQLTLDRTRKVKLFTPPITVQKQVGNFVRTYYQCLSESKAASDDVPLEYLALVINSKACRMQVEQECSGALILHWKPSSIRKLRIPLLPSDKMKKIEGLVIQAKQSQRKSAQLLDQAKSRVEQLIEKAVQA